MKPSLQATFGRRLSMSAVPRRVLDTADKPRGRARPAKGSDERPAMDAEAPCALRVTSRLQIVEWRAGRPMHVEIVSSGLMGLSR